MAKFSKRRPLRPRQRIGLYRLLRPIDEGGQGSVWEAVDPNSQRLALKEFDKPDARTRERIARELQLCAEVEHEHLVRVFDVVEARGRFWVAMSLAEGDHLTARVSADGTVVDQYEFAMVMIQVGCALARIHRSPTEAPNFAGGGHAHRDVKPRNIVVAGHGSKARAVLVDLSLVTPLDGKTTSPLATIRYAAPEQLEGLDPNDRVDVYSLAATGFYMLTGRPPHLVDAPPAEVARKLLKMIKAGPPLLSEHAAATWADKYDELFAEALSPLPQQRPSALEFAKRVLAITWPSGAPYGVVRVPAELEPAALEAVALASPNPGDPHRPREGLVAVTDKAGGGGEGLARQARIVERASGRERALPLYEQAAREGDAVACAWLARDREEALGPAAALDLWRAADSAGSAVAARRVGQIESSRGSMEGAARAFRRAVERRDGPGAFELHQLLTSHPELADDPAEAARAFRLALDLHHPVASRQAGLDAEERGEFLAAERYYAQADQNGDGEAAKLLASIHGRRGDAELAEEAFRRSVERGHLPALLAYARWAESMKRSEQRGQLLFEAHRSGVAGAEGFLARFLVRKDPAMAYSLLNDKRDQLGHADALTLAAAALSLDLPGEAIEVLRSSPESGSHRLVLAAAYFAAGQEERAGEVLDSASAQGVDPWLVELSEPVFEGFADRPAHNGLAPGAYHFAMLAWRRAGEPQVGEPGAAGVRELFQRGRALGCAACAAWVAHLSQGEEAEREELEKAIGLGSSWAMVRLGELLHDEGEEEAAAGAYRAAIDAGAPETARDAGPRYMLSTLVTSDQEEKKEMLREADRFGSPYAWKVLAEMLAEEHGWRYPEIEHLIARADLRGSAEAACRLGLLLSAVHGDEERAEAAHRRSFRRSESGAYAYNVGVHANRRGDAEEAERFWTIAAERGDIAAKAALAMKWGDRGEGDKAGAFAREAAKEVGADDVVNLFMLGRVFETLGDFVEAAACFRRADERGYGWASLSCSRLLDAPEAVHVLQRALEILDDDTHPGWYLIDDHASLRRQIEDELAALPRVGEPNPS